MSVDEKTHIPTGIELTPLEERFREDPYPVLAELRDAEPCHEDRQFGRFVVTRHDDVAALVKDRSLCVDPRKAREDAFSRIFLIGVEGGDRELSMLFLDDPDHKRLRSLVTQAFNLRSVEAMRPRIEAVVDKLLDELEGEREFDLIAEFSGPLPTIVIAEMLGVDPKDQRQFKRWSDDGILTFNPLVSDDDRARAEASLAAQSAYFEKAIEERRAVPRDDLITKLIAAEEEGGHLTTREIVVMCNLLIAAGNLTTTDLIGNGVHALLSHPEELAKLRAQPELIVNAVEEMLRYDSPVTQTGRIPLEGREVAGCPIHAGATINPSLSAANRDPDVYPDADRFDITRKDTHHYAFGGGDHFCLGAPLARLEAQIGILKLVQRFPNLRLADKPLRHRPTPSFRGFEGLYVLT